MKSYPEELFLNNLLEVFSSKNFKFSDNVKKALTSVPVSAYLPDRSVPSYFSDMPALFYKKGDVWRNLSAPHMNCIFLEELKLAELNSESTILVLGSKSGYLENLILSASDKCRIQVIEADPGICAYSKENLKKTGLQDKIAIVNRDPLGEIQGKWDRILVTGYMPGIPSALTDSLADNGILLAPVGTPDYQVLFVLRKLTGQKELSERVLGSVRFQELLSNKLGSIKKKIIPIKLCGFADMWKFEQSLPFPVAYVMREWLNARHSQERFTRMLDICDAMLRFTAFAVFSYLREKYQDAARKALVKSDDMEFNWKNNKLSRTCLGDLVSIMEASALFLEKRDEKNFLEAFGPLISREAKDIINEMRINRNEKFAHCKTKTDREYDGLITALMVKMEKLLGAAFDTYKGMTLMKIRGRTKKDRLYFDICDLTGSHSGFKNITVPIDTENMANDPEDGKLLLWIHNAGIFVNLEPLMFLDECPRCGHEEVFFFNRLLKDKVEFFGYQHDHDFSDNETVFAKVKDYIYC